MVDAYDRLARIFGQKFVDKYKASKARAFSARRKINPNDRRKIMMLVKENFDGDQTSLTYTKGSVQFDVILAITPRDDRWREYEFNDSKSVTMMWKSEFISAIVPKGPLLEILSPNTPYILVGNLRTRRGNDGRVFYNFYVSDVITMEELEDFKPKKEEVKSTLEEQKQQGSTQGTRVEDGVLVQSKVVEPEVVK